MLDGPRTPMWFASGLAPELHKTDVAVGGQNKRGDVRQQDGDGDEDVIEILAYAIATVLSGADVACSESSHHWPDAAAVLQVARNRALEHDDEGLLEVLLKSRQFAHGCPAHRMRLRHYVLAWQALVGQLDVPDWIVDRRVMWFCADRVRHKWDARDSYFTRRIEPAGTVLHIYWRKT